MMLRRYHKTLKAEPVAAPEETPATPEVVEGVEDGSGPESSESEDAAPKADKRSR